MSFLWWFLIALLLAVLEVISVDLFFLTLAIAATAAGVGSYFGLDLWWQIGIFAVVSVVLLLTLRPWARKLLEKSVPDTKLNFQALLGQAVQVEAAVNDTDGRVRLAGDTWTAVTKDSRVLEVGETAYVVEIKGATVVVSEHKPL
ncbi:NfeD family protein [Gleimia sp. 6138-11-ORH1]|uniref:NfeD family protein n=1 Tax=Gleimia sp. 6138-11-ORH1 TaxID=2973937 RepID=UPI0021692887|nr:NfeD family protein [Gleimia sp. 6138-11-ORH1]MCS4484255.1 NfeD family protein [Gleimia sp. 6138-11-ORH1]